MQCVDENAQQSTASSTHPAARHALPLLWGKQVPRGTSVDSSVDSSSCQVPGQVAQHQKKSGATPTIFSISTGAHMWKSTLQRQELSDKEIQEMTPLCGKENAACI